MQNLKTTTTTKPVIESKAAKTKRLKNARLAAPAPVAAPPAPDTTVPAPAAAPTATAAASDTSPDKPKTKAPVLRSAIANDGRGSYGGSPIGRANGGTTTPVNIHKPATAVTDRVQAAFDNIKAAYSTKPFPRHNLDAGSLGRLCSLGLAVPVDQPDANGLCHGKTFRFKLTR